MVECFDTLDVPAGERASYWRDTIGRLFCPAEFSISQESEDRFNARVTQKPIAFLGIADLEAPALSYTHRSEHVRNVSGDDFLASLLVRGEGCLEQSGRQTRQRPGDIVLYDTVRPFDYDLQSDYHMILLKIPRRQLLCRLPEAERLTAIALEGQSAMGSLAANIIRGVAFLNDAQLEPAAAAKVGASVVDIFAAALETELRSQTGMCDRHGQILKKIKSYIQANLDDCELDLEKVSQALGVSPRTLNRIFASDNTTAARWLWQKRLEASHALLSEGRVQHVADAAIACGFSDFSHFSRAFKRAFGVAPNKLIKSK